MMKKKERLHSLLAALAVIFMLTYVVVRLVLFVKCAYRPVEKMMALSLIFAELFILMHSLGYVINVMRVIVSGRSKKEVEKVVVGEGSDVQPPVAILVAARHEPKDVLHSTFKALTALRYSNKQIYFLDDSSDEEYIRQADELVDEFGLTLFRRQERHGAKAGIVNDCLKTLAQKYVVIFDADQNPLPSFLDDLIPLMENNEKLAFVQTPQFYSNMEESLIARASTFQQAVFYEYICEGKGQSESMFCCGTNVVFRTEALKEVGGLDESTVTEDFATSITLHAKGWQSMFYPHTYVFGMGPQNLEGYFRQQFRWASGTIRVFRQLCARFLTNPFSLSLGQWWEYFLSASYYFVGVVFFVLMICPVCYVLLGLPSFFINPEIYLLAFIPYIVFSLSVFYAVLGDKHYRVRDLFLGQMLGVAAFPVYLQAVVAGLFGGRQSFGITSKGKSSALPLIDLLPQIIFILLNFVTVVWAVNRFIYEREPALIINGAWALYHFFLLMSIFYFNDEDPFRVRCQRLKRGVKFAYDKVDARDIESLDKSTWRLRFSATLPEHLERGSKIMCKVAYKKKGSVVFDGIVIWSQSRKRWTGYETDIAVVTSAQDIRKKLKEEFIV